MAFEHHGFWQPMDTLRDRTNLDDMWASGHAPWKIWDDIQPREITAAGKKQKA